MINNENNVVHVDYSIMMLFLTFIVIAFQTPLAIIGLICDLICLYFRFFHISREKFFQINSNYTCDNIDIIGSILKFIVINGLGVLIIMLKSNVYIYFLIITIMAISTIITVLYLSHNKNGLYLK